MSHKKDSETKKVSICLFPILPSSHSGCISHLSLAKATTVKGHLDWVEMHSNNHLLVGRLVAPKIPASHPSRQLLDRSFCRTSIFKHSPILPAIATKRDSKPVELEFFLIFFFLLPQPKITTVFLEGTPWDLPGRSRSLCFSFRSWSCRPGRHCLLRLDQGTQHPWALAKLVIMRGYKNLTTFVYCMCGICKCKYDNMYNMCVCWCVNIYIYMYVCMYVCMYVWGINSCINFGPENSIFPSNLTDLCLSFKVWYSCLANLKWWFYAKASATENAGIGESSSETRLSITAGTKKQKQAVFFGQKPLDVLKNTLWDTT